MTPETPLAPEWPTKNGFGVFEQWAAHQADMNPDTVLIYRTVWHGWLAQLPGGKDWKKATQADVLAYLNGPAPGTGRRRRPKEPGKMSEATRYRYYRVLRGVYKFAVATGVVAAKADPTLLGAKTPGQTDETRTGQVLPPGVLRQLRHPKTLSSLMPQRDERDWATLRDRALVALLAHCGPTTGELQGITGADLLDGGGHMQPDDPQGKLPAVAGKPVRLQVGSGNTRRSVEVPPQIHGLLRQWLSARRGLLRRHTQRMGAFDDHGPIPGEAGAPLFVSRQPPSPREPLPALDERVLYRSVRGCLEAAYATPQVQALLTPGQRVAYGAAIVRNTVIADWLAREDSTSEVLGRAGLEGARCLRVKPRREG